MNALWRNCPHNFRLLTDPEKGTVVLLCTDGVWTEMSMEAADNLGAEEAAAIYSALAESEEMGQLWLRVARRAVVDVSCRPFDGDA